MPTPIAHSLVGLTIRWFARRPPLASELRWALLVVVLANLPDIDFLPGYLSDDPRAYHWGPTHSIFAALLVASVVGGISYAWRRRFRGPFLLAGCVYGSHLLLDLLLGPGAPSVGLQIFWPLSQDRVMLPWSVFAMAPKTIETVGPVGALFSWEILPVIARELALLSPIALGVWMARKRAAPRLIESDVSFPE